MGSEFKQFTKAELFKKVLYFSAQNHRSKIYFSAFFITPLKCSNNNVFRKLGF